MFLKIPAVWPCWAQPAFLLPLAGALWLIPGSGAANPHPGGQQGAPGDRVALLKWLPLPPDSVYDVGEYSNPKRWPRDYKAFLKRNPQVEKVIWHWNQRLLVLRPVQAIVILKSGDREIYNCSNLSEMAGARKKYGRLPWAAPPVARYDIPLQLPARKEQPEERN